MKKLASLMLILFLAVAESVCFPLGAYADTEGTAPPQGTHEEKFLSDHALKGNYDTATEYFHTGKWKLDAAAIDLSYSTSQLYDEDRSEFTVCLNDVPVYSGSCAGTDGAQSTLEIALPVSEIRTDSANAVKFTFHLRSGGSTPCFDAASDAGWVNIYRDSDVKVSYETEYSPDSVAAVYDELTSIDALDYKRSEVLLSGSSASVLTAAGWAEAGMAGNAVLNYENMSCKTADEQSLEGASYILYISDYDSLLPQISALLSDTQRDSAENGALAAVLRYRNADILVLTGGNAAALENAGRMLANASYMRQLSGMDKTVGQDENFETPEYRIKQNRKLTETGTGVSGYFRHSAEYAIDWPANRRVTSSSAVSLNIRYSENIDFTKSLITVYCNNVPIGSSPLDREHAEGLTLDFKIPEDLVLTGNFNIQVVFDLEPVDNTWCRTPSDQLPWGYVTPDSMLKLDAMDLRTLLFSSYPCPFVRDGRFNSTVLLLPETVGDAELSVMKDICAGLGKFLKDNRGEFSACSYTGQEDLSKSNLIAIGVGNANPGFGICSDQSKFVCGSGNVFGSASDKYRIDPQLGSAAGMAELLASPYSTECGVLLVSGTDASFMQKAGSYLRSGEQLWKLTGDAYLVSQDSLTGYTFSDFYEEVPLDRQAARQKSQTVSLLLVAGTVLLLCSATVIMMQIKRSRS